MHLDCDSRVLWAIGRPRVRKTMTRFPLWEGEEGGWVARWTRCRIAGRAHHRFFRVRSCFGQQRHRYRPRWSNKGAPLSQGGGAITASRSRQARGSAGARRGSLGSTASPVAAPLLVFCGGRGAQDGEARHPPRGLREGRPRGRRPVQVGGREEYEEPGQGVLSRAEVRDPRGPSSVPARRPSPPPLILGRALRGLPSYRGPVPTTARGPYAVHVTRTSTPRDSMR